MDHDSPRVSESPSFCENLIQDILRLTEALLVGSGGRPLLQALHFGGVARLSRRLSQFLHHGTIHRDKSGDDSCSPFLESRFQKNNRHLIRPRYEESSDVIDWITERIIESNLHQALKVVSADKVALKEHYDEYSCMRQKNCIKDLLEGARLLDEQDIQGLAEYLLDHATYNCIRPSSANSGESNGSSNKEGGDAQHLEHTNLDQQQPLTTANENNGGPSTSSTLERTTHSSASNSCPDLTDIGLGRFIDRRHDREEEKHKGKAVFEKVSAAELPSTDQLYEEPASSVCVQIPAAAAAAKIIQDEPDFKPRLPFKKDARKTRHKRSTSDTAVIRNHDPKPAGTNNTIPILRQLSHLSEEGGQHSNAVDDPYDSLNRVQPTGAWRLPKPKSVDEPLYSYIQSQEFIRNQALIDQDLIHILLAEAAIYCDITINRRKNNNGSTNQNEIERMIQSIRIQARESRSVLPPGSPIKEKSAEATLMKLLSTLNNPLGLTANDMIKTLQERGEPRAELALEDEEPEEDDLQNATELRGTRTWAPPRPQLILQLHPRPTKKMVDSLKEQHFVCNNCGIAVDRLYIGTFRYCAYFGKYCCTSCHSNQSHVLPANIIHKWDFKEYRVSDYAIQVLTNLSSSPLFSVTQMKPQLVEKVARLKAAVELRKQAKIVAGLFTRCRIAGDKLENRDIQKTDVKDLVNLRDAETFSLDEFCSVKLGMFSKLLKKQVDVATAHIYGCELCRANGFVCEGCRSDDVIFPFQTNDVKQCPKCFACYHKQCFVVPCSKCNRWKQRGNKIAKENPNTLPEHTIL